MYKTEPEVAELLPLLPAEVAELLPLLDLRVGRIMSAEPIEGSELLKFKIDMGNGETKQVLSSILPWYPEGSEGLQELNSGRRYVLSFFNMDARKMGPNKDA